MRVPIWGGRRVDLGVPRRLERAREIDAPVPKLPHLTLKYLDTKGLAEPARLALTVGRIPFEDVRVSYEDVARLRAAGGVRL